MPVVASGSPYEGIFTRGVGVYLILINLAAFLSFCADKRRARRAAWRIPEKTLLLLALFGGSVGAIAGMRLFHHKTRHRLFRFGLPAIFLAHLALACWFGLPEAEK